MSEIRVNSLSNESNTGGPVLSGITTFSGQQYFIPPKGTTAERPTDCPPGSIRFNTDSAHLEYWNGLVWLEFEASSEELGNQLVTNSAGGTGTRGVFSSIGGYPNISDEQSYISVESTGNAQTFSELHEGTRYGNSIGSSTRGIVFSAITAGGNHDTDIQRYTFASTGSTVDFGGNSTQGRYGAIATSNSTRGIRAGGFAPGTNSDVIDYITIASNGTDAKDFGDLIVSFRYGNGCFASCTRGIVTGGYPGSGVSDHIGYITFSTEGNAQDFGNLAVAKNAGSQGGSNATRGIFAGGHNGSSVTNELEFITLASTGNGIDFGDLTTTTQYGATASSKTRLVIAMGNYPSYVNTINYVQIMTTGNALDFGDLNITGGDSGTHNGASNGHGGL